jgi:hypothetical protein
MLSANPPERNRAALTLTVLESWSLAAMLAGSEEQANSKVAKDKAMVKWKMFFMVELA